MNRNRRAAAVALVLAPIGWPLLARTRQDGYDYTVLDRELAVEAQDKVEVIEFFWYGCIHCYRFKPALEAWLRTLPADVHYRRVPAVFNDRWARDAALFYALDAFGLVEKLHRPLFDAIHLSRLRTDNGEALGQWLQRQGTDAGKAGEAMASYGVQSKVRRAAMLTAAYRVAGTPTMAVHGRYTISAEQGGSHQGMLATVDHLVELARKSTLRR